MDIREKIDCDCDNINGSIKLKTLISEGKTTEAIKEVNKYYNTVKMLLDALYEAENKLSKYEKEDKTE